MTRPAPAPKPPPLPKPTEEESPRILIVIDDARVLDLLHITLQGRGFVVETCQNSESAFRLLVDSRTRKPDLAVVDLQLRQRGGLAFCQRVREEQSTAGLPVIMISGQVDVETRIQVLRSGADDLILKPFSPRELILRIQNVLGRVSQQGRLQERVVRLERDLERQREAHKEARLSGRHFRRSLVDGVTQLMEALHASSGNGLEESLVRLIAGRWGGETFAYFERQEDGVFRPALSRGIPPRTLQSLSLDLPSDSEGPGLSPLSPVFLEDINDASPLASLRPAMSGAGLQVLISGWVGGIPVGILGLGGPSASEMRVADEADVARCVVLGYHAMRTRTLKEGSSLHGATGLLAGWIDADETEDSHLDGHSSRVADLCRRIGKRMGIRSEELGALALAGSVHRSCVGPESTCHASSNGGVPPDAGDHSLFRVLRSQNERWNGTGAPHGVAGVSIPLGARVLAVADAFDTEAEVWGSGEVDAIAVLRDGSGVAWDPEVVSVLIDELQIEGVCAEGQSSPPSTTTG